MEDEEKDIEIPGDDDENVGAGTPKKKKEKKKKSKEQRIKERKSVFWTLMILVIITLVFWLMPRIIEFKSGIVNSNSDNSIKMKMPKIEWKNYVEYKY